MLLKGKSYLSLVSKMIQMFLKVCVCVCVCVCVLLKQSVNRQNLLRKGHPNRICNNNPLFNYYIFHPMIKYLGEVEWLVYSYNPESYAGGRGISWQV